METVRGRMMKKLIVLLIMTLLLPVMGANAESNKKVEGYTIVTTYKTVKVYKRQYLGEFWITHYCPCARCCGVGGGKITASGTVPTVRRTVGVNPKLIPYGTKLKVGKAKAKTTYVAEDTGGGIGWKHLDVFCATHQEALNAGVGYEKVWKVYTVKKKKKVKVRVPIEGDAT